MSFASSDKEYANRFRMLDDESGDPSGNALRGVGMLLCSWVGNGGELLMVAHVCGVITPFRCDTGFFGEGVASAKLTDGGGCAVL